MKFFRFAKIPVFQDDGLSRERKKQEEGGEGKKGRGRKPRTEAFSTIFSSSRSRTEKVQGKRGGERKEGGERRGEGKSPQQSPLSSFPSTFRRLIDEATTKEDRQKGKRRRGGGGGRSPPRQPPGGGGGGGKKKEKRERREIDSFFVAISPNARERRRKDRRGGGGKEEKGKLNSTPSFYSAPLSSSI